ncbi:MAG: DUF2807 domain-containing protein [Sphingobium sp.]|nr:DUF2807 domain-containing protein [Sphingobium sp.]
MHILNRLGLSFLLAGALLPGAAQAATRTYIVTDFDTIRLEAPIAVAVQAKRGTTARGEGDADLLQRVDLSVSARVLTIRLKPSPFEGRRSDAGQTARIFLTVPSLRRAQLSGSGTLAIDGMGGQAAEIIAAGSGALSVVNFSGDLLSIMQQGAGATRVSGKAAKAVIQFSGSGAIDTSVLTAADLEVNAQGAGTIRALATRSAKVAALGPAVVVVDGHPACTVRHAGSGTVTCAGKDY